jgi:O-methyltransferase
MMALGRAGSVYASAKAVAKRSRFAHSTVKFVKLLAVTPPSLLFPLRRTVAIFRVLPNTMLSLRALVNVYVCMETLEREKISGNVAECGVWAGGAVGLMATASRHHGTKPRTFHLFDSFEGLPQPSPLDVDVVPDFQAQHPTLDLDRGGEATALVAIGACAAPLDEVIELFDRVLKVDRDQYVIHKGWFQETVSAARGAVGPLALLRVDGDWYESTLACLNGLYDNLVDNGFLILDDYGFFQGCTQAIDEFLASRGLSLSLLQVERWGAYMRKPATE